jgi:hypothetical protein
MTPRRCIDCGELIGAGSRCGKCSWKAKRGYSLGRQRGRQWMRRRAAVMRRAGWTCERCCDRLAQEIHHLGELTDNRIEMLLAVCQPCHRALEAEKRTGSR